MHEVTPREVVLKVRGLVGGGRVWSCALCWCCRIPPHPLTVPVCWARHELVSLTRPSAQDGTVLPYGLCIWSTGVGPTPFSLSLPFAKTGESGRVIHTCTMLLCY